MMPAPIRIRRILWLLIPAAILGAGTLVWVLASKDDLGQTQGRALANKIRATLGGRSHMKDAVELMRRGSSTERLVKAYAEWAGDPGAVEARKLLINALLVPEAPGLKLSNVLGALAADQTAPDQDPVWPYAIERISEIWRGETLTRGLDLIVAEPRHRARLAVISSFAHLVNSGRAGELDTAQRQTLSNYFIDTFGQLSPGQKPEVEQAIRKVAGNDAADILLGKGLGDGHVLEHEREYKKALAEAPLLPQAPDEAPAEEPASAEPMP
jgi:hypothetical protein